MFILVVYSIYKLSNVYTRVDERSSLPRCHLIRLFTGGLTKHKIAINQFYQLLKPGGILFIDHRNYDDIIDSGCVPHGPNVYYQVVYLYVYYITGSSETA